jgi:hypothetical protein
MSPTCFTNASGLRPSCCGRLSGLIGTVEAPDKPMPNGSASAVGRIEGGLAVWSLRVRGANVPGRWAIIDGWLVAVEDDLA